MGNEQGKQNALRKPPKFPSTSSGPSQGSNASAGSTASAAAPSPAANRRKLDPVIQLQKAANNGDTEEVLRLLKSGVTPDGKDSSGRTALFWASWHGHTNVVKLLLEWKANTSATDHKEGMTALHKAVATGSIECVRMLCEAGSSLATTDIEERTPLHLAAYSGDIPITRILVQYGADPNLADVEGRTALHYAAYNGFSEYAKEIIKRGSMVDLRDKGGRTPLIYAANNGFPAVVSVLVESNADLSITDSEGKSALLYAELEGQVECIKQLKRFNRSVPPEKQAAEEVVEIAKSMSNEIMEVIDIGDGKLSDEKKVVETQKPRKAPDEIVQDVLQDFEEELSKDDARRLTPRGGVETIPGQSDALAGEIHPEPAPVMGVKRTSSAKVKKDIRPEPVKKVVQPDSTLSDSVRAIAARAARSLSAGPSDDSLVAKKEVKDTKEKEQVPQEVLKVEKKKKKIEKPKILVLEENKEEEEKVEDIILPSGSEIAEMVTIEKPKDQKPLPVPPKKEKKQIKEVDTFVSIRSEPPTEPLPDAAKPTTAAKPPIAVKPPNRRPKRRLSHRTNSDKSIPGIENISIEEIPQVTSSTPKSFAVPSEAFKDHDSVACEKEKVEMKTQIRLQKEEIASLKAELAVRSQKTAVGPSQTDVTLLRRRVESLRSDLLDVKTLQLKSEQVQKAKVDDIFKALTEKVKKIQERKEMEHDEVGVWHSNREILPKGDLDRKLLKRVKQYQKSLKEAVYARQRDREYYSVRKQKFREELGKLRAANRIMTQQLWEQRHALQVRAYHLENELRRLAGVAPPESSYAPKSVPVHRVKRSAWLDQPPVDQVGWQPPLSEENLRRHELREDSEHSDETDKEKPPTSRKVIVTPKKNEDEIDPQSMMFAPRPPAQPAPMSQRPIRIQVLENVHDDWLGGVNASGVHNGEVAAEEEEDFDDIEDHLDELDLNKQSSRSLEWV